MSDAAAYKRFDIIRFMDDNYLALCVALALVALSFLGIAGGAFTSMVGAILCLAIFSKRTMNLDLWIFIPLVIYTVLSGYANYRTLGTLTEGYFGAQAVYLALYLAIASMEKSEASIARKLCVAWAALVAAVGILMFVGSQFLGGLVLRLSWPMGNADSLGIFMVIAWFAMPMFEDDGGFSRWLRRMEPLLLIALALTLTMTSFGALAIGAIAMLLYGKRSRSWGELGTYAAVTIARLVIGVGAGIALYGISLQDPGSWLVGLAFLCIVALVVFWERVTQLLEQYLWVAGIFVLLAVVLAIGMFLIRANAFDRLIERMAMIQSGAVLFAEDPLFGAGAYGWFEYKSEIGLFPTARLIHSTLMSTAAELGIFAVLALLVVAVRFFIKRRKPAQRGAFIAFLVQNLVDLGFFFTAVTGMLMVVAATPRSGGAILQGVVARAISGVLFVLYLALAVLGFLEIQPLL